MEEEIHIGEIFEMIKRKWKTVVITTVIFVLISIIISFFIIKPKYETNVKVFIGKEITNHNSSTYDNNDVIMYQKLLDTYANIIKTQDLINRALESEKINLNSQNVLKSLTVIPVEDTQILEIQYKGKNPKIAVEVINAVTDQFIAESKKLIANGNIQVLEKAQYPKSPVSPNKKLNIIVAFILGVLVSIGIIFVLEVLDNTFNTKEDIEKIVGVPVIGVITEYDEKNGKQNFGKSGKKKHERRKR